MKFPFPPTKVLFTPLQTIPEQPEFPVSSGGRLLDTSPSMARELYSSSLKPAARKPAGRLRPRGVLPGESAGRPSVSSESAHQPAVTPPELQEVVGGLVETVLSDQAQEPGNTAQEDDVEDAPTYWRRVDTSLGKWEHQEILDMVPNVLTEIVWHEKSQPGHRTGVVSLLILRIEKFFENPDFVHASKAKIGTALSLCMQNCSRLVEEQDPLVAEVVRILGRIKKMVAYLKDGFQYDVPADLQSQIEEGEKWAAANRPAEGGGDGPAPDGPT